MPSLAENEYHQEEPKPQAKCKSRTGKETSRDNDSPRPIFVIDKDGQPQPDYQRFLDECNRLLTMDPKFWITPMDC